MRIGVNTLDILPGFGGGEEIFIRRVLASISSQNSSAELVILVDVLNQESFQGYETLQLKSVKEISSVCESAEIDVLFTSYRNCPDKSSVPIVLLVMGLQDSETVSKRRRFWGGGGSRRGIQEMCVQAEVVLAPSEFVKKELLRLHIVPLNKVVVAPLGIDECYKSEQYCIVQQPYFLAVGKVTERKNLKALLEAFSRIEDEVEHSLVIVGQPGGDEPDHWGERVIRIDRLGTTQLAGLYQHCDMYVCASLYEGSGITVLEAFSSRALVGTGRIGGIEEVAGDAPLFFNPENVDSIVGVLKRATQLSDEERARRIQGGKQLTVEFTWDNCSQKTLSAFRKALSSI